MHAIEGLFKNFQEDSKSVKSRISLKVRTLVGSVNCLHYRMRKIKKYLEEDVTHFEFGLHY